jgi:hypothetical protein
LSRLQIHQTNHLNSFPLLPELLGDSRPVHDRFGGFPSESASVILIFPDRLDIFTGSGVVFLIHLILSFHCHHPRNFVDWFSVIFEPWCHVRDKKNERRAFHPPRRAVRWHKLRHIAPRSNPSHACATACSTRQNTSNSWQIFQVSRYAIEDYLTVLVIETTAVFLLRSAHSDSPTPSRLKTISTDRSLTASFIARIVFADVAPYLACFSS